MNLLTPREVAELLGVPVQTLASWRYFNKGPSYVKAGRLIRYHEKAVQEWIEKNTVVAMGSN